MDSATMKLLEEWRATLTEREKRLHALAEIELKKVLNVGDDGDQGSYFPEYCRAFQEFKKTRQASRTS
jgi:hypothetical protein